jgi:hypothetical protein
VFLITITVILPSRLVLRLCQKALIWMKIFMEKQKRAGGGGRQPNGVGDDRHAFY